MKTSIRLSIAALAGLSFAAASFPARAELSGQEFKDKCDKTPHCHYVTSQGGAVTGGFVDSHGKHQNVDCPAGKSCEIFNKANGKTLTVRAGGIDALMANAGGGGPKKMGVSQVGGNSAMQTRGLAGSSPGAGTLKLGTTGQTKSR